MSVLQAMSPCHLGGLLAGDSGQRNGAANFVARHHRRCHATGQRERCRQPKQQSCKTPIHGRSFTPSPGASADYGEMRSQKGRISSKKRKDCGADKNLAESRIMWREAPSGVSRSLYGARWICQSTRHPAESPSRIMQCNGPKQIRPQEDKSIRPDRVSSAAFPYSSSS